SRPCRIRLKSINALWPDSRMGRVITSVNTLSSRLLQPLISSTLSKYSVILNSISLIIRGFRSCL
ncbi:unnamed protein product, partial [Candidula unifasciata]